MKSILWLLLLFPFLSFSQDKPIDYNQLDSELLNEFILQKVNALRKKKKVEPLDNETLLAPAANDHTNYMSSNDVMTHYQKNKIKKTPKNRVDFYGEQFDRVGENVQVNHVKNKVKVKRKEKAIEVGNINGNGCDGIDDQQFISISKVNKDSLINIETLSIDTIEFYKGYKWGFIRSYWKNNLNKFD